MRNNRFEIALFACLLLSLNCFAQSEGRGFIPDSTSYVVISQPSDLTRNAKLVYSNAFKYPFVMVDSMCIMISYNDTIEPISFVLPEGIKNCEDAIIIDSLLVCKDSSIIKCYDGDTITEVMIMPDLNYNLYPANFDYFYLVKHETDSSSVFLVDVKTGDLIKLFDTPFVIDCLAGTGMECFITSGPIIYYIDKNVGDLIEVGDSNVQSIDFCEVGTFYTTEKACYFLGLPGKSYPFLLGDIKQVMLVDNHLYMLFSDGLLSVIDNVNGYKKLLDKVVNDNNKEENDK